MLSDEALLLENKMWKLPAANPRDLRSLRQRLWRHDGGHSFLRGREKSTWDDPEDLIALSSRHVENDLLTSWITDTIVPWFHRRYGYRLKVCSKSNIHLTRAKVLTGYNLEPKRRRGLEGLILLRR